MMRHFYWLFLILIMGTGCSEEQQNTISTLSPKGTNTSPRTALIIGNASYPIYDSLFSPLANPINDANEMAKVLQNYGFAVTLLTDGTKSEMDKTIQSFVRKIASHSTVLLYYSGHGVSVQGQNYLIPVGYHFLNALNVRDHAVSADWILNQMEISGADVKIMILDACRERFANESKGLLTGGFGEMGGQASGIIISYATAQGQIAWGDTANPHSIYTGALLEVMKNGGHLLIEQVFKAAALKVRYLTEEQQIPWIHSSITGDFCFGQCQQTNIANNVANADAETIRPEAAEVIHDSNNISVKFKQGPSICAKGYASIQHQQTGGCSTFADCRRRARFVAETQATGQMLRLTGNCQTYFKTLVNMGAISEDTQLISCEGTVRASTLPREEINGDEVSIEYCGEVVGIKAQTK